MCYGTMKSFAHCATRAYIVIHLHVCIDVCIHFRAHANSELQNGNGVRLVKHRALQGSVAKSTNTLKMNFTCMNCNTL